MSSSSNAEGSSLAEVRQYHDLAVSLARDAGRLILSAFYSSKRVTVKSNILDIVTETDQQAEQLIIAGVRRRFPHHRFVAEESHSTAGEYALQEGVTWVIDPVDGTNNFVHQLPFVAVSIGVCVAGRVEAAVVHAPVLGETFSAVRGEGAFLTNHPVYAEAEPDSAAAPVLPCAASQRLRTSSVESLSSAAVLTELGYDRSPLGIALQLARLRLLTVGHSLQSLRSYGSCALNMCYVAAGRCEGFYEGRDRLLGPKPWDVSAGWLIVQEAGGEVLDLTGQDFDMTAGRVLAVNGKEIARQMVAVFREAEDSVMAAEAARTAAASHPPHG